ncbi:helix-turn-helix transcriptional regulator [Streptomyces sp. ST1015]|uniref:helix-turn-helix transcriptional regulator n=1 Tax=Streptomyces sp. ST1015 TaxID=1848900 RepID=UPI003977520F
MVDGEGVAAERSDRGGGAQGGVGSSTGTGSDAQGSRTKHSATGSRTRHSADPTPTDPRTPLAHLLPALDLTTPRDDATRIAALDAHFLALPLTPDPQIPLATRLVAEIRANRELRRVSDVADAAALSPRSLQRLFATHVGVTPKWTILRYRLHEALDEATHTPTPDWPTLAADLGYADQSHLIRAFTKTLGVPPEAYVQALA